jgi:hypothetical protein
MADSVGRWSRLEHSLDNGVPLSSFFIAEWLTGVLPRAEDARA